MKKLRQAIVPPIGGIPQISPPQAAHNQRVYIALPPTRQLIPQHTPIPPYDEGPDRHAPPALMLPLRAQHTAVPMPQQLPETPWPQTLRVIATQISPAVRYIPLNTAQSGATHMPSCFIPAYYSDVANRNEPGLRETLMGCAALLIVGVLAFMFLYYLAT